MWINSPSDFTITYSEFKKYTDTLKAESQGAIAHIESFFDTKEIFMNYLDNTYKFWKKRSKEVDEEYRIKIKKTKKEKGKSRINRKKNDLAKNNADYYLIQKMKENNPSKFQYYNPDLVKSTFALYLNYINHLSKENKKKITPKIDYNSSKTSQTIVPVLTNKENYAKWWKQGYREINGEIFPPYTTPEEIELREERENLINEWYLNNKKEKEKEKEKKEILVKEDELGQLYIDFFSEELDSDK